MWPFSHPEIDDREDKCLNSGVPHKTKGLVDATNGMQPASLESFSKLYQRGGSINLSTCWAQSLSNS